MRESELKCLLLLRRQVSLVRPLQSGSLGCNALVRDILLFRLPRLLRAVTWRVDLILSAFLFIADVFLDGRNVVSEIWMLVQILKVGSPVVLLENFLRLLNIKLFCSELHSIFICNVKGFIANFIL